MSSTGPTFIAKIQAAPDTDTWEKPSYAAEDTQYFDAKYHDRAEVDAAVSRLCDPSLQAEVHRYRATRYHHCMIAQRIDRLEGELFATGMKKCASLRRLMAANAATPRPGLRRRGTKRGTCGWRFRGSTCAIPSMLTIWTMDCECGTFDQKRG